MENNIKNFSELVKGDKVYFINLVTKESQCLTVEHAYVFTDNSEFSDIAFEGNSYYSIHDCSVYVDFNQPLYFGQEGFIYFTNKEVLKNYLNELIDAI